MAGFEAVLDCSSGIRSRLLCAHTGGAQDKSRPRVQSRPYGGMLPYNRRQFGALTAVPPAGVASGLAIALLPTKERFMSWELANVGSPAPADNRRPEYATDEAAGAEDRPLLCTSVLLAQHGPEVLPRQASKVDPHEIFYRRTGFWPTISIFLRWAVIIAVNKRQSRSGTSCSATLQSVGVQQACDKAIWTGARRSGHPHNGSAQRRQRAPR